MMRSARCSPAKNTQHVSPTLSATTVPSDVSRSSAARTRSIGTSSSFSASGISSSVGSPQCPSSIASVSANEMPARTRIMAVFSIPSFMAIASAVLNPMPPSQTIWVLGHDLHGIGAISLEDPHRSRRADAVAVQEDHNLANDLLFRPGGSDAAGSDSADASDLTQALRLCLDRIEYPFAEGAHKLLGVDRSEEHTS